MHHFKDLLIGCCYAVILAAVGVNLWLVYNGPGSDGPAKARMKRLVCIASFTALIFCAAAAIIQWRF